MEEMNKFKIDALIKTKKETSLEKIGNYIHLFTGVQKHEKERIPSCKIYKEYI